MSARSEIPVGRSRWMRRALVGLVAAGLLAAGLVAALQAAVRLARREIVAALGAGAEVGALDLGLRGLALERLRIPGSDDWPASDAMRAERVAVTPSLRSLLAERVEVRSIEVSAPYVSALRTREGSLRVLPTLQTSGGAAAGPPAARSAWIAALSVERGELELFDAAVAQRPWRIHLEGIDAGVRDLELPSLSSRTSFEVSGRVDGPRRDGSLEARGWYEGATGALEAEAKLRGVDLLAFEPYLVRSGARLARGALDLDLEAHVREGRLRAPGHLTLADLEFAPGGSAGARFLGVPRNLLVEAMTARGGRIDVDFTLEGAVDDPRFSFGETFRTRVALALAESLGLSVRELATGLGELGGLGLRGAGETLRGLGGALQRRMPGSRR